MILCCKKKWLLALCLALGMPLTAVSIHAQTVTQAEQVVNGVVTDSNGEPIIGASVRVGKSDNGAVTDLSGKFRIANVPPSATLTVSYIGYVTQSVAVTGKQPLRIVLLEDQRSLNEVVVVGYGTMKKSDITGAIASVGQGQLNKQPVANVASALQGLASAFVV